MEMQTKICILFAIAICNFQLYSQKVNTSNLKKSIYLKHAKIYLFEKIEKIPEKN